MAVVWNDPNLLAHNLNFPRSHDGTLVRFGPSVVLTSGGFDPLHVGHLRHLRAARRLGDVLVVLVMGDGFLRRKKSYAFMPREERLEIVAGLEGVDHVTAWDDGTQFVDGAIRLFRPRVFARGGDRSRPERIADAERRACDEVGCEIAYGVGGEDKPRSSSELVWRAARAIFS